MFFVDLGGELRSFRGVFHNPWSTWISEKLTGQGFSSLTNVKLVSVSEENPMLDHLPARFLNAGGRGRSQQLPLRNHPFAQRKLPLE